MITLPEGKVLHLNYTEEDALPAHLLIPGILLTCSVGLVNVIALVYNIAGSARKFNWAVAAGGITICWAFAQALFFPLPKWIDIVYASVSIAEILTAFHLKKIWVV